MANGQQKAQKNLNSFITWRASQTLEDFKQIVFRGQLNRGEIAKAIGCGKSALNQNPALKDALKLLEDELRTKGVLPTNALPSKEVNSTPCKKYDNAPFNQALDSNKLSALEAENVELKVKLKALESKLERFGELSETLSEMGLLPR